MNRLLLPLIVALCASISLSAQQDFSICSQVIGASGNYVQIPGQRWTYTVGEAVIGLIGDSTQNIALTVGFHQPELCSSVATQAPELSDWFIRIFPNPTAGFANIAFDPAGVAGLHLRVYNTLGQLVFTQNLPAQSEPAQLDCSTWQAGIYLLHFTDPATLKQGTFRLVRL